MSRDPDRESIDEDWGSRMFVQVINGKVEEAGAIKAMADRWYSDVRPEAQGWLGTTGGITSDGECVILARFESRQAAQRNSERAEQGEWWTEAEKGFTGGVTFGDYDDVTLVRDGGSDEAGFVQVILGRTSEPDRERALTAEFASGSGDFRPELLGGIVGVNDDGSFAQAFYFTSEADARAGEQQEMPAELLEGFTESQAATTEIRFLDLTNPWFYSAS